MPVSDTEPSSAFPETADIETASDGYAQRFEGPVGQWFLTVQERIVLAMLGNNKPAGILDVGGGHGQLAEPLCTRGFPVTVLGSAASCAKRIESLVASGACEFRVGNVVDLPFEDASFDTVLCFRLLPHCTHWPRLVAELCRVARHSVIVDYPTSRSLNAIAPALFKAKKRIEGNTREWRLFKHREIGEEFGKYGCSPAIRKCEFFLPMVFHRALRVQPVSAAMEGVCRLLGLTALWGSPVIVKMTKRS